jgi:hypothetical protein
LAFLASVVVGILATSGNRKGHRVQNTNANTDRMQKAMENIKSDKPGIQGSAIYGLTQLALNSKSDAILVIDILRYFILEKCVESPQTIPLNTRYVRLPFEVKYAFKQIAEIILKQKLEKKIGRIELTAITLSKMNLEGINFFGADLKKANFMGANLKNANLTGTSLEGAMFCDAEFDGQTDFTKASFYNNTDFKRVKNLRFADGIPKDLLEKYDPENKTVKSPEAQESSEAPESPEAPKAPETPEIPESPDPSKKLP